MRLFILIFSAYILFLALFPAFVNPAGLAESKDCQNTCCHSPKPSQNDSKDKKPGGSSRGDCTPFFGCEKFQVVIPKLFSPAPSIILNQNFTVFSESVISGSLPETWHPPETV